MIVSTTKLMVNEPENTITYDSTAAFKVDTQNGPLSISSVDGSIMFGIELYYTGTRFLGVRNPSGFQYNTYFFKLPNIPDIREDFGYISGMDFSIVAEDRIFSRDVFSYTEAFDYSVTSLSTSTISTASFPIQEFHNQIFLSENTISVPNNSPEMY